MKKLTTILFLAILLAASARAKESPSFLNYSGHQWVDSLMKKMTIDQKIGQLFMIQAYSNGKSPQPEQLAKQIEKFHIGGVIFMQGGPVAQALITNKLQSKAEIPLLVATDAETGLGFRLDSAITYPLQMALGAIDNDSLIYQMGFDIGKQCRRIGVHMNLAPVCDINNNPANPVINARSFGEDRQKVAHKSWMYASGLQAAGILATAKHFPGHGDTETDSHKKLPIIKQTETELDSVELFPFKYLINNGINAVMTGHLQVPALEPATSVPATLSQKIIKKKLRGDLGFTGIVITDAMNMEGVGKKSSPELIVKALKAGNDMIEIIPDLEKAIAAVKLAVKTGEISTEEIDDKCRRILSAKKWLGLDKQHMVDVKNIANELNSNKYEIINKLLVEKSLTVLENKMQILPLQQLDTLKIASLSIGNSQATPFHDMLANYTQIDCFNISNTASDAEINKLIDQLKGYNLIISGIHGIGRYPFKEFGLTEQHIKITEKLDKQKTIFVFFGNPYALTLFPKIEKAQGLIVAYQDNINTWEKSAQLIFGAINGTGKLPVTINELYPINSGITVNNIKRLKYTLPEEVKISSTYLESQIDSIAAIGIKKEAFPGCQVLIAKDGKVIFNKSYGHLTYDNKSPVNNSILYDLASVTKISAPLAAVMKLYDDNKIVLDEPFSNYFAEFKKTEKATFTMRDVLTHQARLKSFIPFYLDPQTQASVRKGVFTNHPSDGYQIRVSKNIYAKNDFEEQVIAEIVKSPLYKKKECVYSDLGFGLLRFVTERLAGETFTGYLTREFYKPLGATTTCYKPYEKFPIEQIAPTENDNYFRNELLQGYVHDEMAAVLGGVSGNAGLFSTANDLAKLMQMYIQKGYYGGKQYITTKTMEEFTKVQFPNTDNNRALGFDKPSPGIKGQKNKFPAADASVESYGHTGYTGTFAWMDPENQLLIILLSNRVYPSRNHLALSDLNIRSAMHQAAYRALSKGLDQY